MDIFFRWLSPLTPDGHYLNLPVVEEDGRLIGIVDVLKLTYATLEQVSRSMTPLTVD